MAQVMAQGRCDCSGYRLSGYIKTLMASLTIPDLAVNLDSWFGTGGSGVYTVLTVYVVMRGHVADGTMAILIEAVFLL